MAVLRCTMSLAFVLLLQASTFTAAVKLRHSAIISYLRKTSDPDVIPLPDNGDKPVEVNFDLWFVKILDVDRERNEVSVLVKTRLSWKNPALAWDVTKEGFNSSVVSIPSKYLWVSDIIVDTVVTSSEVVSPSVADVYSDGAITLYQQTRVRVWCNLQDVDSISGANCSLHCGSWTQSTKTVSLSNRKHGIFKYIFVANPNYDLLAAAAFKHSHDQYECCPGEKFEHIVFSFLVRKHNLPA